MIKVYVWLQRRLSTPCQKVRIMLQTCDFPWPEALSYDNYPEYDKGICAAPEAIVSPMPEDKNYVTNL